MFPAQSSRSILLCLHYLGNNILPCTQKSWGIYSQVFLRWVCKNQDWKSLSFDFKIAAFPKLSEKANLGYCLRQMCSLKKCTFLPMGPCCRIPVLLAARLCTYTLMVSTSWTSATNARNELTIPFLWKNNTILKDKVYFLRNSPDLLGDDLVKAHKYIIQKGWIYLPFSGRIHWKKANCCNESSKLPLLKSDFKIWFI